jgi:hypothetical protein
VLRPHNLSFNYYFLIVVNSGNGCGVNFIFNVAPKLEIDRSEIRGTRGPRYRPVTPDPPPREMVIHVLACCAAEMLITAFLGFLHSSGYLESCSLLDPC